MAREKNWRGETLVRGFAEVGDRVAYEDMANPRCEGTVEAVVPTPWVTQYRVRWDDGATTLSDCRQYGWVMVEEVAA